MKKFVGRIQEEIVCRDDGTDWGIQIGLNGLVDHTQLIAQLTVRAGLVEGSEGVFPEAPSHRQYRVVLGKDLHVGLVVADGGSGEVSGDFTHV